MNYRAIAFGLGAVVFAARADFCNDQICRASYCNLDKVNYLVNVARYEGLASDCLEDVTPAERVALRSALENEIIEAQANALGVKKEALMKAGRIVAGAAILASMAGYIYGAFKFSSNLTIWNYGTDVTQAHQEWIKNPETMPKELVEAKVTVDDIAKYDAVIKADAAVAKIQTLKHFGALIGSGMGYMTGLAGLTYAGMVLERNEEVKKDIERLESSLALLKNN